MSLPDSVSVLLDALEATATPSLRFYIVKTEDDRYGMRYGSLSRPGKIGDARVYDSIGPARALVTRIAKNSGEATTVVELIALPATVFDEAARVAKATEKYEREQAWRARQWETRPMAQEDAVMLNRAREHLLGEP